MNRNFNVILAGSVVFAALCLAGCHSDPPNLRAERTLAARAEVKTTGDGRQLLTMPAPPGGAQAPGDTFVNSR
jgi:hypothetical protein